MSAHLPTTTTDAVDTRLERSLTYELFITAVTLLALALLVGYYIPFTSPLVKQVLAAVDTVVIVPILLLDFFRTLALSKQKVHYLVRWGWLDFLGSFPGLLLLRLLRLARVLTAWRRLRSSTPAATLAEARQQLAQSSFLVAAFVGILTLIAGSIAIVTVEATSPFANIVNGEDAVWWAIVTVATVGYGDFFPVTDTGRTIAIAIMFVGISIFSILTGYLSTTFQARRRRAEEDALSALRQEVAELRTLLEKISQ